jgi:YD repeat-containing protein
MKINSTLLLLSTSVAFSISACKKDKDSEPNYTNCKLHKIQYTSGMNNYLVRYIYPTKTFEYDSENRLIKEDWTNSLSTYKYEENKIIKSFPDGDSKIYKTNNNKQILYHIDLPSKDSTAYKYDGEGYLIRKSIYKYTYGFQIWMDYKYSYSNGNLIREICDLYYSPGTLYAGSDTLTYTYDTTAWFPESQHLYQMPNFFTGKPNRNNITDVHLKAYNLSLNSLYQYRFIHYSYFVKGNRLEKVIMDLDPKDAFLQGTDTMSIAFTYKCN